MLCEAARAEISLVLIYTLDCKHEWILVVFQLLYRRTASACKYEVIYAQIGWGLKKHTAGAPAENQTLAVIAGSSKCHTAGAPAENQTLAVIAGSSKECHRE